MLKRLSIAIIVGALALFAVACGGDDDSSGAKPSGASPTALASQPSQAAATTGYARPDLLAESAWLKDNLSDKTLVIVDLRKKELYDASHIPGAVWYDGNKLKDDADKLHVISDSAFAPLAGAIGIDATKTVIAYDDNAGLTSARFWWVLWYFGHDKARVLNGGWPKWAKEALPTAKEAPAVQRTTFTPKVNDTVICALDYVKDQSAKKDTNTVILDVRTAAEYSGADVRSAKGGHVPNAVNLDWTRSMTDSDPKVWKPAAELAKQFEGAGVKKGMQVITYCQTGVRAAHSLFTLRLMGYDSVKNYDGSWQEWGNNKDTPVVQ